MTATKQINLVVVDDSTVMRHIIKTVLEERPNLNVLATAANGKEAIPCIERHQPDVVLMDLLMGEFDGLYAIKSLMGSARPVPIIVLSSAGNHDMDRVLDALQAGALDYVNKPNVHQTNIRQVAEELIQKIEAASQAKPTNVSPPTEANTARHTFDDANPFEVVILGASTGGPKALDSILSNLPVNLPPALVIAQHIPTRFVASLADRFSQMSGRPVCIGEPGTALEPQTTYVLPSGHNTVLRKRGSRVVFASTATTYPAYNNPSIDSLMISSAKVFGSRQIAGILTGMGKDGAEGLQRIRAAGGLTLAQSERSAVVFGMPKAAWETGGAAHALDLKDIPLFITSAIA